MSERLKLATIPRAAAMFIRLMHGLVRVRHAHAEAIDRLNEERRNYVMAFWHGHLLLMVFARFRAPMNALISQHRDGELFARTMERFGVKASRGSTTRGGSEALRQMVRCGAAGENLAITPDGPKGPRRAAQLGVVTAAQLTGTPIVPMAIVFKKKSFWRRGTASRCPGH